MQSLKQECAGVYGFFFLQYTFCDRLQVVLKGSYLANVGQINEMKTKWNCCQNHSII